MESEKKKEGTRRERGEIAGVVAACSSSGGAQLSGSSSGVAALQSGLPSLLLDLGGLLQ
jgi:hypothetical protein